MDRYRSYGAQDDQPAQIGDNALLGVDEYNAPENIRPGNVQQAVNVDFSPQDATTRGGFVCLPELGAQSFGQVWNYNQIGTVTELFGDVSYGNGIYAAVGNNGAIASSTDAITWTQRTSPYPNTYYDIAFANGVFIAVGAVSTVAVAKSVDGITWTTPSSPITQTASGVSYGNGKWVAVHSGGYSYSTDNGDTWIYGATGELGSAVGLSFGNGFFLAVTGTGKVVQSPDGITWTATQVTTGIGYLVDIAFGNQKFVAISGIGDIYTSIDAVTWTKTRNSDSYGWNNIVYGNGMFVAASINKGTDGIIYSINGEEWITLKNAPVSVWAGGTYANNKFVFVGYTTSTGFGASMYSINMTQTVLASGLYSDPASDGEQWIMLAGTESVGFYAQGRAHRTVSLGNNNQITDQATIVQANNQVYIFRGPNATPLYWDGNWNNPFAVVPATTLPASYNSIPNSSQATFYQNRLWVIDGKDEIAASDVLAFTDYDPLANELSTNTGNSDYLVATFPFGQNSLIAFKNKSILLLQNCEGSLSDVTVTEITRQVGLIGINAVCSIGPDLAYASYGNINLLTLTSTNNSLQHKTLPLSAKIKKIMERVNWEVGYKISMGYWSNKLYVALPLDNSIYCNGVIVYNFITENWYGEWNFAASMNMCIQGFQVLDYLGLQRLHAITEDGRIFVTDEGYQDISGSTLAEISYDLTTRAYDTSNLIHFQRRMFMDTGTIRPSFSVYSYTEGANEVSTLIEDQTYSRSESWKFADSTYTLTNANDDYNRPYRKDYSTGPDSVQCGTGFQPEMYQEYRFPLLTRRQGRLTWLQVTNAQGYFKLMSIGAEARMGQRSSLVTV